MGLAAFGIQLARWPGRIQDHEGLAVRDCGSVVPAVADLHLHREATVGLLGVETDVLAVEDRDVAAALRYIREHACDGANVGDLLKAVPLSRRVLEGRFRKALGRTPHEEILRVKVERVKQLLVETDLNLAVIARRTGFPHKEYLTVAFKRAVGQPPSRYRREKRP